MNKVETKFRRKALERGGIYMYSKADALSFIEECKKHKIPVLGIDGFIIDKERTQPSLENSIDFSMRPFEENTYNQAATFVDSCDEELYFEIVCSD